MELTILILLLPFFSFLLLGIGGKWMSHRTAGAIGTSVLGAVAVLSYVTAFQYFSAPRLEDGTFATLIPYNFTWLPFTETLHFDLGILLDPISVMMLIVISTVSLMVHIYSFGYMKGEIGFQRYYAFLSLFTMSMLGLVVATNIFQMYLFWELVGVSSYLLIGFYYTKPAAISASKKAFIVTRFADLGFLIGILIYGYYGGTFGFTPDTVSLVSGGAAMLPLALGLMFVGGAGKSAMFPLHIWLPDAMEGPTPVSLDSCGYDGSCRSLSGGTYVSALHRICSEYVAHGCLGRCNHCLLCSKCSLCTIGYQTCTRILYHLANWFYDGGLRSLYINESS